MSHRGGAARLLRELSGGLGDAGLFLPIAAALISVNGLDATAVFTVSGLAYVGTALYFRVPVPVQPLKAFAAAAIALRLDASVIAAGALCMSLALALLSATGAADFLARRFPLVLVRGIQASVALLLGKAALDLALEGNWSGMPAIAPGASVAMALGGCVVLILAASRDRVPGALIVLGGGAAAGIAIAGLPHLGGLGPTAPGLGIPPPAAFATALTSLVLAQVPLTFGNAVVATADAERAYFGLAARRVRPGRLAASIAAANAAAGLSGGLPVCHGAGGVTAHYRCGARGPLATKLAGALYVILVLAFGASLPALLHVVPPGALAGMLLYVAVQHGLLAARPDGAADRAIAAAVGATTLASGNLAIGFGCGVLLMLSRAAARRVAGRLPAARRSLSG